MTLPPLDHVLLRQMLFDTAGGRVLEKVLRELGHVDHGITGDQQRIEHNLVLEILTACGAQLTLSPRDLPTEPPPEENLIDRNLETERQ